MENYIGEIRIFPYYRIPNQDGWIACDGQLLTISQNQALYSLLGTMYGGDGRNTFGLPNLNGRTIMGAGTKGVYRYLIGERGGLEYETLTTSEMPRHNHTVLVKNSYDAMLPGTNFLGNPNVQTDPGQTAKNAADSFLYTDTEPGTETMLHPASIGETGGGVSHENRMPFLAMIYCIATKGIYPPRQD